MRKLTEDDRATIERMCPSRVNEDGYELELGQVMLAEIDRLRAKLAETHLQRQTRLFAEYSAERCRKAEAAIARVRELCEGWPSWREVTAAEVLRALDGGE